MSGGSWEWRLAALTDLWTGSVILKDGREQMVADRLVATGLLGSVRWWFEVATRGLGGAACDPSDPSGRCPEHNKRCIVCELFGCTGWGRKFRFEVRDDSGAVKKEQIRKNGIFSLCFTPLRPMAAEEWVLLDLTIGVIADYGAIGGKTVLKPSDERVRAGAEHHRDYGIVKLERRLRVEPRSRADIERYVHDGRWRRPPQQAFACASLTNFWCVAGKYLARQSATRSTFNRIIGRPEPKGGATAGDSWLAGQRPDRRRNIEAASKKVFSFKEPARTFGFVNPGLVTFEQMRQRLTQAWGSLGSDEFVTGDTILERLTTAGRAPS